MTQTTKAYFRSLLDQTDRALLGLLATFDGTFEGTIFTPAEKVRGILALVAARLLLKFLA